MAVRSCSWLQFRALLLALVAVGFLRAQRVVVLEPGNLFFTPATVQFTAVIDGGPEEPVVWSVARGSGTIDPTSGLFQAIDTFPDGFGTVTVRATLVSRPDVSGTASVMVVGPKVASLLDARFRKRLIDHGPGWLYDWIKRLPFNDPATGAPPPGVHDFPVTQETPYKLNAYGRTWKMAHLGLGYGYQRPFWFGTPGGGRGLFGYGNPLGSWALRQVKDSSWIRFSPFPETTVIKVQATTTKGPGAYQTERFRIPVFVMGVTPFAGRHLNPGNDDGQGPRARFMRPSGLARMDPGPGTWGILVSDQAANSLRLVDPSGTVKTYAGAPEPGLVNGPCRDARFNGPTFIVSGQSPPTKEHAHGDWTVFVADTGNNVIRRIHAGHVTTFAGTGLPGSHDADAAHASFNHPRGLAFDRSGNLYVADSGNFVIRRIDAKPPHAVTTFAGTPGTRGTLDAPAGRDAQFWDIKGLLLYQNGECLGLVDGNAIRSIKLLGSHEVSTLLGRPDVPGYQDFLAEPGSPSLLQPCLRDPWSFVVGKLGLLIADEGNHAIREFLPQKPKGSDAAVLELRTIVGDPSLQQSRPGLFRAGGFLPPGQFRDHFAALGAPRNLFYLPAPVEGVPEAPSFLVTDGSALNWIRHLKNFPAPPPPRLEVPATAVAGKPFTIRLRLREGLPEDGSWPGGPFDCSLDLLDRDDAEPLERLDFAVWAMDTKELTLTVEDPGAYTVRVVAMDASAEQFPTASAHVQVVAKDLGGTAAPAPGPAPAQTPAPAVPWEAAPAKAPQKPAKKKKKKKKASGKQPSSLPAPRAQAAEEPAVEDPDDLEPEDSMHPPSALKVQESKETKADEASPHASREESDHSEVDRDNPFTLVRIARGSLLLARQGFKLRPLALQHIRQRHIEACRDDEDELIPGRFSAAYGGSDGLRTLLAEGLAPESRLEERPSRRAGRYEFLCRKAKVGTVAGPGGTETATDLFRVVAYKDQDDNFWHIITAYPVRAPGAGAP